MELTEEGDCHRRKAQNAPLRRDNYRCIIGGDLDHNYSGGTPVRVAHIILEAIATRTNIEKNVKERAILAMLIDGIDIALQLAGNKIHCPESIATMTLQCYALFDDLDVWLKPVEVQLADLFITFPLLRL
ncbi:hypothetical protein F5I97DRAFT_1926754 [Phlebopus sp. FC_14]|nr:hypothetical protein F5I97DRAFT_1926754 [Phlebopus sp. FC_14]